VIEDSVTVGVIGCACKYHFALCFKLLNCKFQRFGSSGLDDG